ncbi:MAG TPA: hypothetical protein IAC17_08280 [Candidatus Faecousia faecipullorum]|nr:hypothetical protein [Candidatus Faecousia faecipullorum]
METVFEFLTQKEAMWAQMLIQVLKDNNVPYTAIPVHGAGLTIKTGMRESLNIFVPKEAKEKAQELMEALFPESEA